MKKLLFLICFVSLTKSLFAQSTQFDFTFNHLALSVKDLNRSVEFYQKTFQLKEITNRTKNENIRWLSLGEGKELHLISNVKEEVKINKAVHLAITTQHLDEFIKWLDDNKIEFSDYPGTTHKINIRADGIKQIYVQDPDGYWIEINNGYSAAPTK
ncbi:MAG: VOC family protein [Cyclobacteriaceae bacterium]